MKIGVALTEFDNEIEPILDPSMVDIVFYKYHWGKLENGTYFSKKDVIPHHQCNEDSSPFFPVTKGN